MRRFWKRHGTGGGSLCALLLAMATVLLSACGDLRALRDDLRDAERTLAEVSGTAVAPECTACPLILVVVGAGSKPLSYRVLDGSGEFRVVVGASTVGIFAFLASWNDFMMPSLIISDPAMQTLPVVQKIFQTQFSNNYNVSFASYLMAMAPALIAYLFTQRWVMEGVTQGAVKG